MAATQGAQGGMPKWVSVLNSPIASMGLMFGAIQLLRKVDTTDRRVVLALRAAYIASQMAMLLVWLYIRSRARASKKDEGRTEATVVVEEAAAPFSGEPPRRTTMTVSAYDTQEIGKQMQQVVVGAALMLVLHFWMGLIQPLFLQLFMPWKALLTQPLVLIHVFGAPATGTLQRPFKQPSPFADLMAAAGTQAGQADAPAVEADAAETTSDAAETSPKSDESPVLVTRRKVKANGMRKED